MAGLSTWNRDACVKGIDWPAVLRSLSKFQMLVNNNILIIM